MKISPKAPDHSYIRLFDWLKLGTIRDFGQSDGLIQVNMFDLVLCS